MRAFSDILEVPPRHRFRSPRGEQDARFVRTQTSENCDDLARIFWAHKSLASRYGRVRVLNISMHTRFKLVEILSMNVYLGPRVYIESSQSVRVDKRYRAKEGSTTFLWRRRQRYCTSKVSSWECWSSSDCEQQEHAASSYDRGAVLSSTLRRDLWLQVKHVNRKLTVVQELTQTNTMDGFTKELQTAKCLEWTRQLWQCWHEQAGSASAMGTFVEQGLRMLRVQPVLTIVGVLPATSCGFGFVSCEDGDQGFHHSMNSTQGLRRMPSGLSHSHAQNTICTRNTPALHWERPNSCVRESSWRSTSRETWIFATLGLKQ